MKPWLDDGDLVFHLGDCVEVMRELPDASVDAVVCDPPYGLGFMGKDWDTIGSELSRPQSADETDARYRNVFPRTGKGPSAVAFDGRGFQAWCESWAVEALRVLRPGGHLAAFGGTRTYHRLACAVEDAGFEVRDSLCWLYGSGFPKSLDVSKAIDKAAGAERAKHQPGNQPSYQRRIGNTRPWMDDPDHMIDGPEPVTAAAAAWQGWGTALKPAYEPIVLARKPLVGTVAANVLEHGTGALNIDGCRIEGPVPSVPMGEWTRSGTTGATARRSGEMSDPHAAGRWPANVVLDEAAAAQLDEQSGESRTPAFVKRGARRQMDGWGMGEMEAVPCHGDSGGASRFFYTAKASRSERGDDNTHPTVKPVALMRWLIRLVTPPGGLILDPFCGSGTTPLAARQEGYRCIAIDREAEYLGIAARRTAQLSLLATGGTA